MVGADFELVVMNVHRNEQSPNTCACHPEVAAATEGAPKCEQQARIIPGVRRKSGCFCEIPHFVRDDIRCERVLILVSVMAQ